MVATCLFSAAAMAHTMKIPVEDAAGEDTSSYRALSCWSLPDTSLDFTFRSSPSRVNFCFRTIGDLITFFSCFGGNFSSSTGVNPLLTASCYSSAITLL